MSAIKKKRGQLSCEKCGIVKRSVNGFISHMQFCGKSEEVCNSSITSKILKSDVI